MGAPAGAHGSFGASRGVWLGGGVPTHFCPRKAPRLVAPVDYVWLVGGVPRPKLVWLVLSASSHTGTRTHAHTQARTLARTHARTRVLVCTVFLLYYGPVCTTLSYTCFNFTEATLYVCMYVCMYVTVCIAQIDRPAATEERAGGEAADLVQGTS